ncbi:senescence-associated protein 13-like isoform X2 [Momordica charantia]|uniref:Senescence-associated protein 13-like isoform X2 n=1 Tax=Momordica charantia TaxID=3673 RepID=A0A6J1E2V9_MOMCH|nr:senescence-associated protein 13-like isoform X2 [Momordica charantia]
MESAFANGKKIPPILLDEVEEQLQFLPPTAMAEVGMLSRDQRWSLTGKAALVTGGTRGIGRAIVEELAALGASVHTCSRNQVELDQILQQWRNQGFQVSGSVCDVLVKEQREKLIETVSSLFGGKLNILVNNAGLSLFKSSTAVTEQDISCVMGTNFEASFHFSQLAHPLLKASESGNIVFISSVAGVTSFPFGTLYSASKESDGEIRHGSGTCCYSDETCWRAERNFVGCCISLPSGCIIYYWPSHLC